MALLFVYGTLKEDFCNFELNRRGDILAEAPFEQIANCPNPGCKSPILSSHPYPWCADCGEPFPEDIQSRLPRVQETRAKAAAVRARLLEERSEAAKTVEIRGRRLQCVVCRHDHFVRQEIDSETIAAAALFGLGVANASGIYFVCAECGYVHWFRW